LAREVKQEMKAFETREKLKTALQLDSTETPLESATLDENKLI